MDISTVNTGQSSKVSYFCLTLGIKISNPQQKVQLPLASTTRASLPLDTYYAPNIYIKCYHINKILK